MTDRYLRHNVIDWFDQERIQTLNALVIGVGAVGNEVIKNLCLLGIGSIRVVDFDQIEIHNLTRSVLFTEEDIGKNKALAAATAAARLDPNCKIEAVAGDFWDKISFDQFQDATVVFCCVDNFQARLRINRLCNLLGVDLINIGIDARSVSVEIYPFHRDPNSACYECNLPPSIYQREAQRYSCGWLRRVAYDERRIPTTTVTASMAGALATSLFLNSFRDDSDACARRIFLDTVTYTASNISLPTNASCVCCGTQALKRIIVRAGRFIEQQLPWLGPLPADLTLTFSDPILVKWETPNCTMCSDIVPEIILQLACDYDESHTMCDKCGIKHRLPVIRDQYTVGELIEDFNGRSLPGKYVHFENEGAQIIVELLDGGING